MRMTAAAQAKFLSALYNGHSVKKACELSGIPRRTVYYHKAEDMEFADAWKEALDSSVEVLEDEVRSRALDRSDKQSYVLLMFLLKKHKPEYRDNYKQEIKVNTDQVKEFDFSKEEIQEAMLILSSAKQLNQSLSEGKDKQH